MDLPDHPDLAGLGEALDPAALFRLGSPIVRDGVRVEDAEYHVDSTCKHSVQVSIDRLDGSQMLSHVMLMDDTQLAAGAVAINISVSRAGDVDPIRSRDADHVAEIAFEIASHAGNNRPIPTSFYRFLTDDPQVAEAFGRREDLWLHHDSGQQPIASQAAQLCEIIDFIVETLDSLNGAADEARFFVSWASTYLGAEVSSRLCLAVEADQSELVESLKATRQSLLDQISSGGDVPSDRVWIYATRSFDQLNDQKRAWLDQHLPKQALDPETNDTARELLRDVFGD